MNIFFFIFIPLIFINTINARELNQIQFHLNSSDYNNVGYDDKNIETNGELSIIKKLISDNDLIAELNPKTNDWVYAVNLNHNNIKMLTFELGPEIYDICYQYKIQNINFLKISYTGRELEIIKNIFAKTQPLNIDFIQFEYGSLSEQNESKLETMFIFLRKAGYSIFRIYSDGLIFIPKWNNSLENFKNSIYLAVKDFQLQDAIDQNCIVFHKPIEVQELISKYLPKKPNILEAGAYDGKDSVRLTKLFPGCTIYSFEPVPQSYKLLTKNTKPYKNIKIYKTALGDTVGTITFYVSSIANSSQIHYASSSFLKPKEHLLYAPHVVFNDGITVPITTIDKWAKESKVDHIDYMWLDMQGAELIALKSGPQILKTVKVIFTEVEFIEAYENQPLYKDVKNWLEGLGFKLAAIRYEDGWAGDAVFVRD